MGVAVQPDHRILPGNHACADLVSLFEQCFRAEFNTRLVAGGREPEYLPANANAKEACIVFTRDYFASALHEIAHWCLAGPERRQQLDYGYWYAPDGRNAQQQEEFERVEVKPQALEWLFAEAAGFGFRVSVDNLNLACEPSAAFKNAIAAQAQQYVVQGLPRRASVFVNALLDFYDTRLVARQFDAARL